MAALEAEGITMCGDLSLFLDGAEEGVILTISEDGTGNLALGDEGGSFKWELADDNTLTLSKSSSSEESLDMPEGKESIPLTYGDDALLIEMSDEDMTGNLVFTKDGSWAKATIISSADLTDISEAANLVGEWKLSGVCFQGVTMYGKPEDLSTFVPSSTETDITINEDGTARAMGSDVSWVIEDGAAALDISGIKLGLKAYSGGIAMDMSEFMGSEMIMLYSK